MSSVSQQPWPPPCQQSVNNLGRLPINSQSTALAASLSTVSQQPWPPPCQQSVNNLGRLPVCSQSTTLAASLSTVSQQPWPPYQSTTLASSLSTVNQQPWPPPCQQSINNLGRLPINSQSTTLAASLSTVSQQPWPPPYQQSVNNLGRLPVNSQSTTLAASLSAVSQQPWPPPCSSACPANQQLSPCSADGPAETSSDRTACVTVQCMIEEFECCCLWTYPPHSASLSSCPRHVCKRSVTASVSLHFTLAHDQRNE